ncbi:hypothetical protein C8J57DRAFT_1517678 [Mycena rebaudengoi]|nr:hypothetical protein C8J57DRAFT_1517678 [Mycena rebaudengoi]
MNVSILPAFPPELEREVFEIAAIETPQSMPQLVRVVRLVCVWIEPLLYRTLILTWERDPDALRTAIEIHPAKFAKYLQNLLEWEEPIDKDFFMHILSLCSGIRNLVMFSPHSKMVPSLEAMQLRRLSVILLDLVDGPSVDPPPHPLFRTLTHLDLWDSNMTTLPFSQFPALTHLSVNNLNAQSSPFLASTLRGCARLCVLVDMRMSPFAPGLEAHHSVDDPRFVLMCLTNEDYVADWKVGDDGGKDFWVRAELFVAKRKRGEVQPASRYWIEETDFCD